MTIGRQIFETTIGKLLLPWLNLGFTGAVCALVTDLVDSLRNSIS